MGLERVTVADELEVGLLYEQLRKVAYAYFRSEPDGHTLQPTALVNEALMRLLQQGALDRESPQHLAALAARYMRNILVDYAQKRGGGMRRVTLTGLGLGAEQPLVDVMHLHGALERLSRLNPRQEQVVELRLFAGLTNSEIAQALGIAERTVERDWRFARAWLSKQITAERG